MKVLGIIVNVFLPGVGTLIVGKIAEGIAQIILYVVGLFLTISVFGSLFGIPLCIAVWIWAIVSAATSKPQPTEIIITHRNEDGSSRHGASGDDTHRDQSVLRAALSPREQEIQGAVRNSDSQAPAGHTGAHSADRRCVDEA